MLIRSLAIALFVLLCGAVPAQAGVRVALMPIAVYAAGADSVYLQSGLAEMIAARLDQYEGVSGVRPEIGGAPPASVDAARVAAESAGAGFVLFGSFTRFGEGASLDMQAVATAEGQDDKILREIFVHSGSIGEVIPDLEDLVGKVTRFAISGYSTPQVSANGPAATPTELEARVRALEADLAAVKSSLGAGD